jgi:hypothetical protein
MLQQLATNYRMVPVPVHAKKIKLGNLHTTLQKKEKKNQGCGSGLIQSE